MAPFSILVPFLRRKAKKYERLETEDPERKRQEATLEELTRINMKIVSNDWPNHLGGS
jgi:hypothetical protein